MKITELIKKLKEKLKEVGNVEVYRKNYSEYSADNQEIEEVEIDKIKYVDSKEIIEELVLIWVI